MNRFFFIFFGYVSAVKMVFLRGAINAGSLVKSLTASGPSPFLTNVSSTALVPKRLISNSEQQQQAAEAAGQQVLLSRK